MKKVLPVLLLLLFQVQIVAAAVNPSSVVISGTAGETKVFSITYTNDNATRVISVETLGLGSYVTALVSQKTFEPMESYTFYFMASVPASRIEGLILFKDNSSIRDAVSVSMYPTGIAPKNYMSVQYPDRVTKGDNLTFVVKDSVTGSAVPYATINVSQPINYTKTIINGIGSIPITETGYWSGSITAENYMTFYWIAIANGEKQEFPTTVTSVIISPSPPVIGKYAYVQATDNTGQLVPGITIYVGGLQTGNPGAIVVPDLSTLPVIVKKGEEIVYSTQFATTREQEEVFQPAPETQIIYRENMFVVYGMVGLGLALIVMIIWNVRPEWLSKLLRRGPEYPR